MTLLLRRAPHVSCRHDAIVRTRPRRAQARTRARALPAAGARPAAAGGARASAGKSRCAWGSSERPPGAAALASSSRPSSNSRSTRRTAAPRRGDACCASRSGFGLGVAGRHVAWRARRLFGAGAPPARSDPAGAARDPVDRLGAAVHPVARHFRGLESHADRGRRVLSGLSRRDGRDPLGRPQDRRGRPRVPPLRARRWCGAFCCRRCCRPM